MSNVMQQPKIGFVSLGCPKVKNNTLLTLF
jgi:hypothetical protein